MRIDDTNYEAYWLDYLEGRLDPVLSAELMAFLAGHPLLELSTDSFPLLGKDNCMHMPNAEQLKKDFCDVRDITTGNFDEFCIAAHENLLGEREKQLLSDFCTRDPQRSAVFDYYGKLRLVKDPDIRFPFKGRLKKRTPAFRRLVFMALATAAAVSAAVLLIHRDLPADAIQSGSETGRNVYVTNIPSPATQSPMPSETVPDPEPTQARLPARTGSETAVAIAGQGEETVIPGRINPLLPEPFQSNENAPGLIVSGYLHIADEEGEKEDLLRSDNLVARQFAFVFRRLNLVKAAEATLQGINYLTESELALAEVKDESGNRSGLMLETERRVISGTIPR